MKETAKNIKRLWKYVKNYKKELIGSIICSILLCIISAISPVIYAKLLLKISNNLTNGLIKIALLVFALEIMRNIFSFIYAKVVNTYTKKAILDLQYQLINETLKLEIKELDKKSSGLFIERINNDTNEMINIFNQFSDSLMEFLTNIGILVAIFIINKIFFLYFIILCISIFIIEKIRTKKYFNLDKSRRKINEKNTGLITELVRGLKDIKVLNIDNNIKETIYDKLEESQEEYYKMNDINKNFRFLSGNLKDLLFLVFIILGIYLIKIKNITPENFIIIYMYRGNIEEILSYTTWMLELIKKFNISTNRVFEIIEGKVYEKEKFGKIKKTIKGNIKFENVNFSYTNKKQILKNINFEIKNNKTYSIVGLSGSGKSTILSLICKLYDLKEGRILIDNIDINEYNKDTLRNNIAYITQNPYIFNMSIKDNLKIVNKKATNKEIEEIIKITSLDTFINTLENGIDTIVGEGGITLSGGEKQRLAIARALLKGSKIILLDEATSALDNITQEQIKQSLNNLKGKYTIIIVAHRLSTIIDSDEILMIENGKIIEKGTHKELLNTSKKYKKLYNNEI